MTKINASILALIFGFSGHALAKDKSLTHGQKVSSFVNEYFGQKNFTPAHESCSPTTDCTDVVCNRLGQFGCDDKSEIDEVLLWCRGNYGGNCIEVSCKFLGQFGCDDRSEVQEIARACVGNFGGDCITSVCGRLRSAASY